MVKVEVECSFCKNKLYKTKRYIAKAKCEGYKNFYCSNACQGNHQKQIKIKKFEEVGTIKCGLCKETKHFSNFNKNKTQTLGYQSVCRECNRERSKRYYKENPEKHREEVEKRNKKQKKIVQDFIIKYLKENPCIKCGENDLRTLQFDHRNPTDKVNDVSSLIGGRSSLKKIVDEISKCDVLCANCHSKRTSEQFNWYKQIFYSS